MARIAFGRPASSPSCRHTSVYWLLLQRVHRAAMPEKNRRHAGSRRCCHRLVRAKHAGARADCRQRMGAKGRNCKRARVTRWPPRPHPFADAEYIFGPAGKHQRDAGELRTAPSFHPARSPRWPSPTRARGMQTLSKARSDTVGKPTRLLLLCEIAGKYIDEGVGPHVPAQRGVDRLRG